MPTSNAPDMKDRATRAMRLIGVKHPQFLIAWRKVRDLVKVDPQTSTFSVDDRGVIRIGPTFAATLSPAQFGAVLVHELMHLALDHGTRARSLGIVTPEGKAIDRQGCTDWNVAGDWVINERMKRDGFDLPKCAIYPPKEYPSDRARTSEAFYFWIREQRSEDQNQGQGGSQGDQGDDQAPGADQGPQSTPQGDCSQPGGTEGDQGSDPQVSAGCGPKPTDHTGDQSGQGEGSAEGESGLSDSQIRQIAREIRASARQLGIGVGSSACLEALEPSEGRMPWERLIRSGFDSANARKGHDRPTYSRRSRRSPVGSIMPGWIETDPKIVILIDASTSMDRRWISRIVGEVERMCKLYQAPALLIVHTDQVVAQLWITPGSKSQVSEAVQHKGGTRATPAYDAAREAGKFDVAIHFTDCEIEKPWPEGPARRLLIGAFGSGASGEPYSTPPEGAELIPIMEGGAE